MVQTLRSSTVLLVTPPITEFFSIRSITLSTVIPYSLMTLAATTKATTPHWGRTLLKSWICENIESNPDLLLTEVGVAMHDHHHRPGEAFHRFHAVSWFLSEILSFCRQINCFQLIAIRLFRPSTTCFFCALMNNLPTLLYTSASLLIFCIWEMKIIVCFLLSSRVCIITVYLLKSLLLLHTHHHLPGHVHLRHPQLRTQSWHY